MSAKEVKLKTMLARRRRLGKRATDQKVDAMLISRPEDVGYFCAFTGDSAALLVGKGWSVLISDGRFMEQAPRECPDIDVVMRKKPLGETIKEALKGRNVRKLGVQADVLSVTEVENLVKGLGARRVKTLSGVVKPLRIQKDEHEIRQIRKAVGIAQRALDRLISRGLKGIVGRSERDVAAELEYLMRLEGADKPAFETILAAGPHACDCHHMPDSMKLRRGVSVLIDWGANIGGYCSDMTRTIFLGEIPKKIGAIYEVVSEARKAAMKTLRAGAMLKSPDIAARKVISDSGHEFIHSIGHGLGREVHESPFLGPKIPGRLKSGMVVTIEPGIYLPGVGGVRLEDDFLITHKGYKCLGTMTTDMRSMVLS